MRNLNSLTRDASHAPGVEVQSLNLWTTREVPNYYFLFLTEFYICIKYKITLRKQSKTKSADSCSSFSMSASQRETLSTLLVDFFVKHLPISKRYSLLILLFQLCLCAKSLQSCSTLCNPMNHSLSASSVHGILQAKILEWVAMPSSRASS